MGETQDGEYPERPSGFKQEQLGKENLMALYNIVMIVAILGLAGLLVYRMKGKKK